MKRIAILIGGLAAAAVLSVGLVAAGFGPIAREESQTVEAASTTTEAIDTALEAPEAEIVYVKPSRERRTIVVERQAQDRSSGLATPGSRVRTVRARADRDDDRAHEDREDREDRVEHEEHEEHDD